MKAKPVTDPTSWRYQAAIHDYDPKLDPFAVPGELLPPDRERFWAQCQHASWFFLPWHRMYLHFFEGIVAAEIANLGGPSDWALPYWNYSVGDASRLLPSPFRSPTRADGSANPLYVAARAAGCNEGETFTDAASADVGQAFQSATFQGAEFGGSPGFGGPVTRFAHDGQGTHGLVESSPHDLMHGAVAGDDGGWMGDFTRAPLDPIFWLHHCNIDWLWSIWLTLGPGPRADPATASWLDAISFPFHDATGAVVSMTPRQVVDSSAAPLGYGYDDMTDPRAAAAPTFARGGLPMASKAQPEMVGATTTPVVLSGQSAHAAIDVQAPTGPMRAVARAGAGSPGAAAHGVFLHIENVTGLAHSPAYDVYVNVPVGTDPNTRPDLCVGRLPLFGLREASDLRSAHGGLGLHHVFDITSHYAALSATAGWDPTHLRVSFVPTGRRATSSTVRVGRVSLYFA